MRINKEDDFDINKEGCKEEIALSQVVVTSTLGSSNAFQQDAQSPLHNQDLMSDFITRRTESLPPPDNTEDKEFMNNLILKNHMKLMELRADEGKLSEINLFENIEKRDIKPLMK